MTPRIKSAWDMILKLPDGRIVLADVLARCAHFRPAVDTREANLQQFALKLLGDLNLYTNRDSFPVDFIEALQGRRPEPKQRGWLARLLKGKQT